MYNLVTNDLNFMEKYITLAIIKVKLFENITIKIIYFSLRESIYKAVASLSKCRLDVIDIIR